MNLESARASKERARVVWVVPRVNNFFPDIERVRRASGENCPSQSEICPVLCACYSNKGNAQSLQTTVRLARMENVSRIPVRPIEICV